jgi:hypothetical protein
MKRVPVFIFTSVTSSSPSCFFGLGAGTLRGGSRIASSSGPFRLVFDRVAVFRFATLVLGFVLFFATFSTFSTFFSVFLIVEFMLLSSLSFESRTRPSAFSETISSSLGPSTETTQCVVALGASSSSSAFDRRMPISIPPARTSCC